MFSHKSEYFFGDAARLWWAFELAGLFALLSPNFIELDVSLTRVLVVGFVFVVVGLVLKLHHSGIQIDNKTGQARNYLTVFGVKTGDWRPLPSIKKITSTSKNVSSWNTPNGISPTFKTNRTIYTIALFADNQHPEYFIQTENKAQAEKRAIELSKLLNASVETL